MAKRVLLSWSSGKDAAWALHVLRDDPGVEVVGLFSSVNERYERVSMHATRAALVARQAAAVGLPLHEVRLPDPCTNEQYREVMGGFVAECRAGGIGCMAFGDLFLEDVRRYREEQLADTGIEPVFPLWGLPTGELADRMLAHGLEAYVSSVDLKKLPVEVAGRRWSRDLIADLPPGTDPCGENGEMHTIVTNGPMFRERIDTTVGEIVERDGFAYADIIPV